MRTFLGRAIAIGFFVLFILAFIIGTESTDEKRAKFKGACLPLNFTAEQCEFMFNNKLAADKKAQDDMALGIGVGLAIGLSAGGGR